MEQIKRLAENDPNLKEVGLYNISAEGSFGMKHLSEALKVNTVLTNLDLRYNNIGAEGSWNETFIRSLKSEYCFNKFRFRV